MRRVRQQDLTDREAAVTLELAQEGGWCLDLAEIDSKAQFRQRATLLAAGSLEWRHGPWAGVGWLSRAPQGQLG